MRSFLLIGAIASVGMLFTIGDATAYSRSAAARKNKHNHNQIPPRSPKTGREVAAQVTAWTNHVGWYQPLYERQRPDPLLRNSPPSNNRQYYK